MKSMEEMMQAAQQAAETIQKQMGDMQVKLDAIEVEGQAGGGLVKVRASAKGRILGVSIDADTKVLAIVEEKMRDAVLANEALLLMAHVDAAVLDSLVGVWN